jgi:hypothetical protein
VQPDTADILGLLVSPFSGCLLFILIAARLRHHLV